MSKLYSQILKNNAEKLFFKLDLLTSKIDNIDEEKVKIVDREIDKLTDLIIKTLRGE